MDIKPYCANIEIINRCNYDCIHCFDYKKEAELKEMSLHKFKVIIDKLEDEKIFFYNIIGGEPLLHKKWKEIIRYLYKKGACYSISTNGSLLNEKNILYLKNAGLNHIKLSLDGPEKIHNKIRKNNQAFHHLIRCTKLLKKYKMPFSFQMTVMESNYRFIGKTCEIAKTLGASAIRINFYKDFNNLVNKSLKSLTGKNLKKAILQIETLVKTTEKKLDFKVNFENSLATIGKNKSTCGAGTNKLQIDTNGDVTPCRYLPINMGNLYTNKFAIILNHPIRNTLKKFHKIIKKGCKECSSNKICRGGCPAFIYNTYGNFTTKDPRC